jgi:colanic acid biosynthesis protein WcaH
MNFANQVGFGTHYIVLAYELLVLDIDIAELPRDQHGEWSYFTLMELLGRSDVHDYTKAFFKTSET